MKVIKNSLLLIICCVVLLSGCGVGNKVADANVVSDTSKGSDSVDADAVNNAKENNVDAPVIELIEAPDDKYGTYYEIFVGSFYDSNGDGMGDFEGITQNLDYLNDGVSGSGDDLEIDGIWLMPIMPSDSYHKYDVKDYMAVDEKYGTMEELEKLVAKCHERGIKLIIDLPINHSADEHPWFTSAVEYLSTLTEQEEPDSSVCPYVEYYTFSREKNSVTGAKLDNGWYYEARFDSGMPDLNLDSEVLRDEIKAITDFWFDKGIDGFRLDGVKEYYSSQNDRNIEFLSWFEEMVCAQNPEVYLVGEVWDSAYNDYYSSGIDSLFDFSSANKDGMVSKLVNQSGLNAKSFADSIVKSQDERMVKNEKAINAPFLSNHDMARAAGYFAGDDSLEKLKMAHAIILTQSGNAFLYYGEELGMKGSGRDENKRGPMRWVENDNAEGMCDGPTEMEPVKQKYDSLELQKTDENSLYCFVKKAISWRNKYPGIARGKMDTLQEINDETIFTLTKEYENQNLLLIYNVGNDSREVDLSVINDTFADKLLFAEGLTAREGVVTYNQDNNRITLPGESVALFVCK